jgi:hypothetical protein
MLSGKLFPYHPKPQPDELLSSWIIRTARGHGQMPYQFCQSICPKVYVWNRDVDRLVPQAIIDTMATRTATPGDRATATTIAAYEGELMEFHSPRGQAKWVLRGGIYHRLRRRAWLQYCPCCLAEDQSPYFRRKWRLALVTTCIRHKIILCDRCPRCDDTVMPHRSETLYVCHNCEFDLRNTPVEQADIPTVSFQARCEAILDAGWGDWEEARFLRSVLFFDLLHQVLRVLSTGARSQQLRTFIAGKWGGDPTPFNFTGKPYNIELLSTRDRHKLFGLTAQVMGGWPWRYIGACSESHVWYTWAMRDMKDRRYAYSEPVERYLKDPYVGANLRDHKQK